MLAIFSEANLTSELEESKHSLLINVKGVTDFFFYFIIFNLKCGSLVKLPTKNSNEIKMYILFVGIYTYMKKLLKKICNT